LRKSATVVPFDLSTQACRDAELEVYPTKGSQRNEG
jgi:hypothetical protein